MHILVIDFHTHTFPIKIAADTIRLLEENTDFKAFGDGTENGLVTSMEESDVEVSVVMPVITKPRQFRTVNRCAAEMTEKYSLKKKKLVSFGGIHPNTKDYRGELDKIKELGLKGIKLHPDYQHVFIDDERYIRIIRYARELGLYVTVHGGFDPGYPVPTHCTPERVVRLLDEVPGDHLIIAHLGGIKEWDEVEALLINKNVMLDTAICMTYISEERFIRMVRSHGSRRILFGTDWPWDSQRSSIERLRSMHLTDDEKEDILWRNGARILGPER